MAISKRGIVGGRDRELGSVLGEEEELENARPLNNNVNGKERGRVCEMRRVGTNDVSLPSYFLLLSLREHPHLSFHSLFFEY